MPLQNITKVGVIKTAIALSHYPNQTAFNDFFNENLTILVVVIR
ncbi:MAG: hypothetical protein AAFS12_09160 [Cyanobacteria bacterium J06632_19]